MLLIRPLLRANAWRRRRSLTVIFFIFLVSNIGGVLTPLGDPPLFLGFLHGVPFAWTLRLWPQALVATTVLLLLFFALDGSAWELEDHGARTRALQAPPDPVALGGAINLVLLGVVVLLVIVSGAVPLGTVRLPGGIELPGVSVLRDAGLIVVAFLSLGLTPPGVRRENGFSWGPIVEVAWLFAAIFVTIIPVLEILRAGPAGSLAPLLSMVDGPASYFWITGGLSAILDNAPTYLTFFNTALAGVEGTGAVPVGSSEAVRAAALVQGAPDVLAAISCGAVFMGANTYIGNAPNFMVRSIAEEAGVSMPGFFGYVFRWSLPILLPLFALLTLLFFRGPS